MSDVFQPPSRLGAVDFWCRSRLLALRHAVRERWQPSARRWPAGGPSLAGAPILARQRTPLWSDGPPGEFVLVAGKVQNLRVALPAFHAVEVPAGEVLSFWRQLGRPTARRGFVEGREVRAGCVVPSLAGGICQLTNALATVAQRAGFELVERHAHTARVDGAAAAGGIDATVFWNYLDLKLRSAQPWRLEVEMTPDELIVTVRGKAASAPAGVAAPGRASSFAGQPALPPVPPRGGAVRAAALAPTARRGAAEAAAAGRVDAEAPAARGCLGCDQSACFRKRNLPAAAVSGRTAVLLDAWTPEFARWLEANEAAADRLVLMSARLAFWRPGAAAWPDGNLLYRARGASLRRALWQRLWARHAGGRRQASLIDGQRWLAEACARRLGPQHTRLVVDQALLPHLERLGVLAGRTVDVLASALTMAGIEARLDAAARRWPQDASLRDFRVDPALALAEARGLARAGRIVTAHAEAALQFAALGGAVVERLPWAEPDSHARAAKGAADALAAKSAAGAPRAAGGPAARGDAGPPLAQSTPALVSTGCADTPRCAAAPPASLAAAANPTATVGAAPCSAGPLLVFPASALARKGVHELAAALRGFDRPPRLRVLGAPSADPALWRGLPVEHATWRADWLAGASAVVLPAHVDHAPRALLQALAAGVPVIATPACGLGERAGVATVPAGDVDALIVALRRVIALQNPADPRSTPSEPLPHEH